MASFFTFGQGISLLDNSKQCTQTVSSLFESYKKSYHCDALEDSGKLLCNILTFVKAQDYRDLYECQFSRESGYDELDYDTGVQCFKIAKALKTTDIGHCEESKNQELCKMIFMAYMKKDLSFCY